MRIILTGDRFCACHKLVEAILRRLVSRYGTGIEIAYGDDTGVDDAVAAVCRGFRIRATVYP
jgi:hypothetical protein